MTHSYFPRDVHPRPFCVTRAANDLLFTEDGTPYIDLLGGSGTVFLGHANPAVVAQVREQLAAVWNTAAVPTRIGIAVQAAVESFLPPSHRLAVLYSTGMEAAEFAIRVARQTTGRKGVVGFDGCMHGKSMATARLGWPNDLVTMPDFHRLPYLPQISEAGALEGLTQVLSGHSTAAVFLEPLLGSRGGYIPSRQFAERLSKLCADHGTLLVMDEILTGFHRTGPTFLHQDLGVSPDILLIGKAMGNGFPVSGVVVDRRYAIDAGMFPGSTFAGNALAASVVLATLTEMRAHDMPAMVARIEQAIVTRLSDLEGIGVQLRGKGALWVLELPRSVSIQAVLAQVLQGGVVVSQTSNFIRLMPAATIEPNNLSRALDVIHDACQEQAAPGR